MKASSKDGLIFPLTNSTFSEDKGCESKRTTYHILCYGRTEKVMAIEKQSKEVAETAGSSS